MNKLCQYNKPNCQRMASYFHVRKLDLWEFQRNPICANCKEHLKKMLKNNHE